jgi:ZIP family zinc transporter
LGIAALAGSIFLSNLPEAAGGAKRMAEDGLSKAKVLGIWIGAAALIGNLLLKGASDGVLAAIKSFAAGAVIASLATEVFPKGFREDHQLAGLAAAIGLVLAAALAQLGS